MTDIWDEKPKLLTSWGGYADSIKLFDYYSVKSMDAWLEKLTVQWELERDTIDTINEGLELANIGIGKLNKKLKAIRKLTEIHGLVVPIPKILKILEGMA